jgi:hypothetical protein
MLSSVAGRDGWCYREVIIQTTQGNLFGFSLNLDGEGQASPAER